MFAEPSNLPDFAKVINMSPLPPQTHLYTTHTHTQWSPRFLPLEFPKLSPVMPSAHLHLRKSLCPS